MAHDPGWDGTRTKTAICPVVSWIRTASNAYFPQVVSVLSLPDRGSGVETAVQEIWDLLQAVDSLESLSVYTGSLDAEGTLGDLVQQARHSEDHLMQALRMSALCSNDPVCAQHVPGKSLENRWLHGAACHGCALVAETSCEMRNDYLDRALVVPVLGVPDAAFFQAV